MIPILRVLMTTVVLTLGIATVQAASFACDKAARSDEKAICDTRALNDFDVELAVRFEILKDLLAMGNRTQLQDDQETWLKERHACEADVACLRQAYEGRLKVLRGVFSEFAKQGPQ